MRRLSLGTILIVANAGLVFLAVVGVSLAALSRLETLADAQALARADLAGATAVRAVEDAARQVLTSARLLSERPTLVRLLQGRDLEEMGLFLDRYRRTSRLSACVVTIDGQVLARGGADVAWPPIPGRAPGEEDGFLVRPAGRGPLLLGASREVHGVPGARAAAARLLDADFQREVSEQVGLPVAILHRDQILSQEEDARAGARWRCLDSGAPVAERLDAAGVYLSVRPLHDVAGGVVGIVETGLARTGVAASLRRLERSLLLLAAVVASIAILLSFLAARWLSRPLESLKAASARIGGGDLGTPIPRSGGREVGALAAAMEEMRGRLLQLTAELRQRQAQSEAILTGIADGVFAVDRERRIRYLNPQAAAILGVDADDVLGRFCGDVLKPEGPGGIRPCEVSCPIVHARFGGSARATELLNPPRGGRRSVVITSAADDREEVAGSEGAPEGTRQFQVIRDETEVEAARSLRDAVLGNISHEFRTPLTAQLASIELLRERLQEIGAPEARELVLSIERGTLRLTQLIDNLLESVRIEAGRHSIRRRLVALDEVVEEAMEMTTPLIAQREQELVVDLPYPLPPVLGDAPRLTQVFVNLLANANKFAPHRSRIGVGGAVGEADVTVWVEDEGPGIPPGADGPLFGRFARSAAPDADDEEPDQTGMGLGLWIVKSIVERHGGRVEARRGDKGGARMCVVLPVGGTDEDPRR